MKRTVRGRLPGGLKFACSFELSRDGQAKASSLPRIDVQTLRNKSAKIFCIGFPKTGTTSLESALTQLGVTFGNQAVGEMLAEDWANERTERIVKFCHTADAFQDLPFSMPGLYKHLDSEFPGSKFILTVRDSPEQWFNSLLRFHTSKFSTNSDAPTEEMLAKAIYRYRGFILDTRRMFWDYPEVKLYDRKHYTRKYVDHVESTSRYFEGRTEDFLTLNVAHETSYQILGRFFGVDLPSTAKFPWLNKTN